MGKILFYIAEVIYKFVALNVLWLIFFLLGLGVFGFMPATVALFRIQRKWMRGEKEIPLFTSFYKYYKEEFVSSNVIGLLFVPIIYILYVNYAFVPYFYDQAIQAYIYIIIIGVSTIVLMTLLNIFSVKAHFDYKTFQYIKVAFGLVFVRPLVTLMQAVWLVAYILVALYYPKVFIVIGVSVFSFVIMQLNYSVFKKFNAV